MFYAADADCFWLLLIDSDWCMMLMQILMLMLILMLILADADYADDAVDAGTDDALDAYDKNAADADAVDVEADGAVVDADAEMMQLP